MKKISYLVPPFAHQQKICNAAVEHSGFAIFADMGTGKSKCAIELGRWRLASGQIKSVLIVCPRSCIENWRNEIKLHAQAESIVLDNRTTDSPVPWKIISYGRLKHARTAGDTMIVFDESTYIKNNRALRSKYSRCLAQKARYRLIMTGTPITNTLLDLWNQWYCVDLGNALGRNYYDFRRTYFWPDRMGWNWRPYKETKDILMSKMSAQSFVVSKAECLDLPEKIYVERPVELLPAQRRVYDEMLNQFIAEYEGQEVVAKTVITKLLKLSQITSGFFFTEAGQVTRLESAKLTELLNILENELYGKQILVWARFRPDIEAIEAALKGLGISCDKVYGETQNPFEIAERYNRGELQAVIANPQSGGYGLNLIGGSQVIYYSNDYSLTNRLQSEDRSHRIGMRDSVTYLDLVAKDTIDVTVLGALRNKRELLDSVITDLKAFATGGSNIERSRK